LFIGKDFLFNLYNYSLSSWISHLFNKCHKQGKLDLIDLYDLLPDYQAAELSKKLEDNWLDEIKQHSDQASLFHATLRTMRWKPLLIGSVLIPFVSENTLTH
jgi:hypothetical protein